MCAYVCAVCECVFNVSMQGFIYDFFLGGGEFRKEGHTFV